MSGRAANIAEVELPGLSGSRPLSAAGCLVCLLFTMDISLQLHGNKSPVLSGRELRALYGKDTQGNPIAAQLPPGRLTLPPACRYRKGKFVAQFHAYPLAILLREDYDR